MGSSAKKDKRRIEQQEHIDKALQLRKQGLDYRAIARVLGCDYTWAWRLVQKGIKGIPQENADQVRVLELERLDRMLAGLWPKASGGEVRAVEASVRLMERRARLLGLDAVKEPDETPATFVLRISAEVAKAAPAQPKVTTEVVNASDSKDGKPDPGQG